MYTNREESNPFVINFRLGCISSLLTIKFSVFPGAEHLLKKVQSAEKEIESHESAINSLLEKVKQIPDSHKFADEIRRFRDAFSTDWDLLKKLVLSRMRRLEDSVFLHKVSWDCCKRFYKNNLIRTRASSLAKI